VVLALAGSEPRRLRLLACGCVLVHRATGGRPVDQLHELLVLGFDLGGLALVNGGTEAPCERFHTRAVAQVLEPLAGGDADALFLLLDVGQSVKVPA